MSDNKRKEVIEAILKAQNQASFESNNTDLLKPYSKNEEVPNTEMDVLLSFTEDAFEELEEANSELENANSELEKANKKLAAQNKIIQAYSKQQELKFDELKFAYSQLEHFAQVGSHDLKEPLRGISNFSQLLNEHCAENIGEEGQTYLEFILKGVNQLHNTLNHFIDYLEIDGQFNKAELVDLNELLAEINMELGAKFNSNSFVINVEKLPSIVINKVLFKRLLKELIVNAIKFKHTETPKIEISCNQLEEDFWSFKVKDNGIGLDEKLNEKIFTPFQRTSNNQQNENRPIGLAVCQKIVKLHGGDIWYDSVAIPGQGTTFLFTIHNIASLPFENNLLEI